MPELRWILLGLGVLLIVGLWGWEARRTKRTGLADEEREQERFEPSMDADEADGSFDAEQLPSMRARMDEREIPASDPPIVMIDDDPVMSEAAAGEDPVTSIPLLETPVASIDWPREPLLKPAPSLANESHADREMFAESEADVTARTPVLRPAAPAAATPAIPVTPPVVAPPAPVPAPPRRGEFGSPAGGDDQPVRRDPAIKQKIVAIRIVAIGDRRFEGPALRAALESEGLQFGKYSVFHREREDGRVLYSVASLVEPGSFNLDEMAKRDFPGVSLFAVFPGPVDAPQAFDDMLATSRRLAEQLGGALQDERRNTLSTQRVLSLREELAHFQHVVAKIRDRQAG